MPRSPFVLPKPHLPRLAWQPRGSESSMKTNFKFVDRLTSENAARDISRGA